MGTTSLGTRIAIGLLVMVLVLIAWALAQQIGEAFGQGIVERLVP